MTRPIQQYYDLVWNIISSAWFWIINAGLIVLLGFVALIPKQLTDEQLAEMKAQKAASLVKACHAVGGDAQLNGDNRYAGCILPHPSKRPQ